MNFLIRCFKLFMNFIYCILKLFPIKDKVTFISRQSNEIGIDFKLLIKEIEQENSNVKIVVLNKRLEKELWKKVQYFFHMFRQMYHIATSKVVVLDSYCIVVSILNHKKKLKVVQIWHALGSLKKFGYSSLDKGDGRSSKIARLMNMHKNYTYILTSSEISKPFFQEAFDAKEGQMKIMSLPRVDFLQNEKYIKEVQSKFFEVYPEVRNNKQNILYCPTQRKDGNVAVDTVIKAVDFQKYNLIIKLHDGQQKIYVDKKALAQRKKFLGMELLHVTDYIITDYSAIVYEAAITEKPIYFYAYDYDTYMEDRGWYINYQEEMPGAIEKDIGKIMNLIVKNEWDKQKVIDFKKKYIDDLSNNVTKKIAKMILEGYNQN